MLSNRFINIYQTYGNKFARELSAEIKRAIIIEINQSVAVARRRYELINHFITNQLTVRALGDALLSSI